jgi:hypothetical protein
MKSHQFQCSECEEIRSSDHYIPDNQKIKKIVCVKCLAEIRQRHIEENQKRSKDPVRKDAGTTPKVLHTHIRQQAEQKIRTESQQQWDSFVAAYKTFDISVLNQAKQYSEPEIPEEIAKLSGDEIDLRVTSLIQELSFLRSSRYHQLRREAFEEKINIERKWADLKEQALVKKRANERRDVARRLKGASRKMFKLTGLLPNELMAEFMKVMKDHPKK